MSPENHSDGGIPRVRRAISAPLGGVSKEERWLGANEEKAEKLLLKSLKRQAGVQGLQLRHSERGYALIDSARKQINDRNDMTLHEVESLLGPG
jgi:hypothetical protein